MTPASSPASTDAAPSAPPSGAGWAIGSAPRTDSGDDPILCSHCGRTARNGLSCQGICVADSGY